MTDRCVDLDEFFDGELPADRADGFREHLATCESCQTRLHGRMQERIAARAAPAPVVAAGPSPRPSGAARARRRWLVYLGPVLAAAAAAALWLHPPGKPVAPEGFELTTAIEHGGSGVRGNVAHLGDTLHLALRGERHPAIWVFLDDRAVSACPGDVRCSSRATGELALELPLAARGHYTVVGVDASVPMTPRSTLDETLAATQGGDTHVQVEQIDVD